VASSTRKSSTCHPGSVLVRYSEMLLLSLPPLLLVAGACGAAASPALRQKLLLVFSSSDGGAGHAAGSAESRTPVSRNRVWRMVSSLAVCTDTSQSRHRIALSSLQNRRALFSCIDRSNTKTSAPHRIRIQNRGQVEIEERSPNEPGRCRRAEAVAGAPNPKARG
jgi:hypothetical protein